MGTNVDLKGTERRVEVFIPNERMGEFTRKVAHIQAAARRLDLPEWLVTVGEKEWRPVQVYSDYGTGQSVEQTMQLEGCPVSIVGEAPVLDGWRFLARIEHGVGGNLVKRMVDGDSSPAEWHTCGPNCTHCNVSRQRNNTFMLQNVESGEVKQVGSSCISDFLGEQSRDPEKIAGMYEYLMQIGLDFDYDPEREYGGVSLSSYGVSPERLMACVLKIVQEDSGFISADKGEALGCLGTGDRLRAAFWSKTPIEVVPDAGHLERVPEVIGWLKDQKGSDSLWLRNIAYLADRPGIVCKDAGLFASGYVAWNRELQKRSKAEHGSDWVGVKGEKVAPRATLERHAGFDTAYGFKTVLTFCDDDGNNLVWKTQSPPAGLVVGSTYRVMATVKEHGEYRGDKQTEITRAKVAELELFSYGSLPAYKKFAALAMADVGDDRGNTPLTKAIWADEVEYAKVLLAAGANPNQLNQGEIPVLAYATSVVMAQVLLSAGARAGDVGDKLLDEMVPEAREVVVAAVQVLDCMEVSGGGAYKEVVGMEPNMSRAGAGVPPPGWEFVDPKKDDSFDPWGISSLSPVFEKQLKGDSGAICDLTILYGAGVYAAAHGGVIMPDRVTTKEDAAGIAMEWGKANGFRDVGETRAEYLESRAINKSGGTSLTDQEDAEAGDLQDGISEAWQMTKDDWHDEEKNLDAVILRRKRAHLPESDKPTHPDVVHRASVVQALASGKMVSPEVMEDYPDLALSLNAVSLNVVHEGNFNGKILHVMGGVAVQKIGRGLDDVARHDVEKLSEKVCARDVVNIKYCGGIGMVSKQILSIER